MPATVPTDSDDLRSPLIPAANEEQSEKLCVDEMLQKYCGEFGRWQLKHFVLTNLAWALEGFHTMIMIFADRQPDWKCLPGGSAGSGCSAAASVCGLPPGSWEWVGGRGAATVSEWGLICGDKFKVGLAQALFFVGGMIGAGIFGHLSDSSLGRKGTLSIVCILNAIFGCVTSLSPNYWIYALLRLFTGFSSGGVGLCAFVLSTEPVGPTKRGAAGMSTFYFFSTGIVLLSGIAYIFQQWRHLYIAASIPSILFVLFVIPFLSESPRWYIVRGRVAEAMKLMSTIASTNGKNLPSDVILVLDEEASSSSSTKTNDHGSGYDIHQTYNNNKKESLEDKDALVGSILDVVRSPITRIRLFLAVAINFLCSVVYYGISLNVVNLDTNLYMNVALNAMAEMPAFAITAVLLDRLGRKPLAIGTMWFSGFFCLMASFIRNVGVWKFVRMVCGILGIFGVAGTYNLLYIYTAELFPTVVRNAALGCTSQAALTGAILAPIVVVLGSWLPFALFAVCGIAGGMFAFYLPETLNKPLYDTFIGLEAGDA